MTTARLVSPRPARVATAGLAIILTAAVAGCGTSEPPTASPTPSTLPTPTDTPEPTPTPSPTPAPTPRYTNEPDPDLAALVPTSAAGATITVAPFDEFALTPGDLAVAFGEIGNRFESLVLAYSQEPRTSLYAMRVDGPEVRTADLRPYLASAGRYVGIAGLDPKPWKRDVVDGTRVWTRPEDNATALGTHIYTWSSGDIVFLLIGVDDAVNRSIVSQLPGEAPPSRTPAPSGSAAPSAEPSESPEG